MSVHPLSEHILSAEADRLRAMVDGDLDTLGALLHPGLVYLHASGKSDSRQSYLAKLRDGKVCYARIDCANVSCRGEGPIACVEGNIDMLILREGAERTTRLAFVSIWSSSIYEGWQLAAWAGTSRAN